MTGPRVRLVLWVLSSVGLICIVPACYGSWRTAAADDAGLVDRGAEGQTEDDVARSEAPRADGDVPRPTDDRGASVEDVIDVGATSDGASGDESSVTDDGLVAAEDVGGPPDSISRDDAQEAGDAEPDARADSDAREATECAAGRCSCIPDIPAGALGDCDLVLGWYGIPGFPCEPIRGCSCGEYCDRMPFPAGLLFDEEWVRVTEPQCFLPTRPGCYGPSVGELPFDAAAACNCCTGASIICLP